MSKVVEYTRLRSHGTADGADERSVEGTSGGDRRRERRCTFFLAEDTACVKTCAYACNCNGAFTRNPMQSLVPAMCIL